MVLARVAGVVPRGTTGVRVVVRLRWRWRRRRSRSRCRRRGRNLARNRNSRRRQVEHARPVLWVALAALCTLAVDAAVAQALGTGSSTPFAEAFAAKAEADVTGLAGAGDTASRGTFGSAFRALGAKVFAAPTSVATGCGSRCRGGSGRGGRSWSRGGRRTASAWERVRVGLAGLVVCRVALAKAVRLGVPVATAARVTRVVVVAVGPFVCERKRRGNEESNKTRRTGVSSLLPLNAKSRPPFLLSSYQTGKLRSVQI